MVLCDAILQLMLSYSREGKWDEALCADLLLELRNDDERCQKCGLVSTDTNFFGFGKIEGNVYNTVVLFSM